jgi:Uma2 family endonuclease
MSQTQAKLMTAEELLKLGDIGRSELIYGELRMMSPAGAPHGVVAARLAQFLGHFVDAQDLGLVFGAETGFTIERDPDTVRAPDASFVRKERVKGGLKRGFFEGVPDLAAEVVSPDDTRREIAEKVNMWLANGCKSCWIADPQAKTISVQYPDGRRALFHESDTLVDETLPGFALPLAKVFRLL